MNPEQTNPITFPTSNVSNVGTPQTVGQNDALPNTFASGVLSPTGQMTPAQPFQPPEPPQPQIPTLQSSQPQQSQQPSNFISKDEVKSMIANAPQGIQPADIVNGLVSKGYQLEGYPTESPSVGGFLGNIITSGGNLIGGAISGIANVFNTNLDKNTLVNLGKLAFGGVEAAANAITGTNNVPSQASLKTFNNFVNYLGDRYGSVDNFLNTLYKDPVGVAADASVVLGGAGALAGKLGEVADVSNLTKAGEIATKASELANPFNAIGSGIETAAKGIGNVAAGVLGNTSGIGYGTAKEFLNGNETAVNAMRSGEVTEEGLVKTMQDAYNNLRKNQLNDYRSAQEDIAKNYPNLASGNERLVTPEEMLVNGAKEGTLTNGVFSQGDLRDMFSSQVQKFGGSIGEDGKLTFTNSTIPLNEQTKVSQMWNEINNWTNLSPEGINNLENLISDYPKQSSSGNFQRFAYGIDSQMKTYLREKIPQFAEADANYAKVSNLMKQVKSQLNVGGTAQPQTILNKILKVANNDEDMRNALLKEMSQISGKDIEALAAGIKAHNWVPGGIFSKGLELFGLFHPQYAMALLTTSPRTVGEFLNGVGLSAEKVNELSNAIKLAHTSLFSSRANVVNQNSIPIRIPKQNKPSIKVRIK